MFVRQYSAGMTVYSSVVSSSRRSSRPDELIVDELTTVALTSTPQQPTSTKSVLRQQIDFITAWPCHDIPTAYYSTAARIIIA
jgi:hypothetical protein